jgi:CIC family chloride channel protein
MPRALTARIVGATILAGGLAGLGAIGFHYLADSLGELLLGWGNEKTAVTHLPYIILVPAIGLFLIGWFLQLVPEARIGGVREVLDSLTLYGGRIRWIRLLNVVASALVLAVGGSVGPEGPMVQLGALVGSQSARSFGLTGDAMRTMVRAGAAAGIAAAFRSPAGGVLLTLEIFGAKLDRDLTAIATAAGIGYLLRTSLLGDAYPFRPTGVMDPLPTITLFTVVPVMGLLAAPAGHFFIRMFEFLPRLFPQSLPLWLRVTLGGIAVGILGIWMPQIMSSGYSTIIAGIAGKIGVTLFVMLLFFKMFATSITFGSGAVGGLFAPTLVIGSLFGGAIGYGLHAIMPQAVPQPELFVLLGMIVMFGSIIKGYLSGLFMIADMSGCYHQLLLPGVIAGGLSYLVSWELYDRSIFGLKLDAAAVPAEEEASVAV